MGIPLKIFLLKLQKFLLDFLPDTELQIHGNFNLQRWGVHDPTGFSHDSFPDVGERRAVDRRWRYLRPAIERSTDVVALRLTCGPDAAMAKAGIRRWGREITRLPVLYPLYSTCYASVTFVSSGFLPIRYSRGNSIV